MSEVRDSKGNGDKGKKLLHKKKCIRSNVTVPRTLAALELKPLYDLFMDVNVDKCHRQKILSLREYTS